MGSLKQFHLVRSPMRDKYITEAWKEAKAIVNANYDIPARVAKRITIRVPEAPVGSDICLKDTDNVRLLNRLFPQLERVMSLMPWW